jgi:hypothetical protein
MPRQGSGKEGGTLAWGGVRRHVPSGEAERHRLGKPGSASPKRRERSVFEVSRCVYVYVVLVGAR